MLVKAIPLTLPALAPVTVQVFAAVVPYASTVDR